MRVITLNTSTECVYYTRISMAFVARKPVFTVSDLVRLRPACPATETFYGFEILREASFDIIHALCEERATKALIRLRERAGWSAHLLFACNKVRYSRDEPNHFLCMMMKENNMGKVLSTR